ncbi:MAG: phosphatase PAP2 family protein [candidate division Zixibacteria bacterium]
MTTRRTRHQFLTIVALIFLIGLSLPSSGLARQYLSGKKMGKIAAGTLAAAGFGHWFKRFDSTKAIFWNNPTGLELKLQHTLGGEYYVGKSNFLDHKFGAAVTPIASSMVLAIADLSWPQEDRSKGFFQDQFLFLTGIVATKAATDIAKGLFRRRRPLVALDVRSETDNAYYYEHNSFFSGHTSAAFFSMAYVNIRLRSIMRWQMSHDSYNNWKWAPPTVLFSWATVVGWSRVHAYKHYATDIVAGALLGFAIAEIFEEFGEMKLLEGPKEEATNYMFRVNFTF